MRVEEETFKKVFGESVEETLRERDKRGGSSGDIEEGRGSAEREGGGGSQFGSRYVEELVLALREGPCGGIRAQKEKRRYRRCADDEFGLHARAASRRDGKRRGCQLWR